MAANYTNIDEANAAVDSIHDQLLLALQTIQDLKEQMMGHHATAEQNLAATLAQQTTHRAVHHDLWGRVSAMAQRLDEATRVELYAIEQEARAFINGTNPVPIVPIAKPAPTPMPLGAAT